MSDSASHRRCRVGLTAAAALTAAALEMIDDVAASTHCDAFAELFLETPMQTVAESVQLEIGGSGGQIDVAFASATTQINLIAAINSLTASTGVISQQAAGNPQRVRLHSVLAGADAFVSVKQISGSTPVINAMEIGGTAAFDLNQTGEDGLPGDVDCDRRVNGADLSALLGQWGLCPLPEQSCDADLNDDRMVNVDDLLIVLAQWGAMVD